MTHVVRPVNLLDALSLRTLPLTPVGGSFTALDGRCCPGPAALLPALLAGSGRHRLFVAHQGRHPVGAAHVACQNAARRWDVVRSSEGPEAADWLSDLLLGVAEAAACEGVERLVAHIDRDDPRALAFEDAGFRPYTQETVFATEPSGVAVVRDGFRLRPYRADDRWRLHRVAAAATPQSIQSVVDATTSPDFLEPFARGMSVVVDAGGDLLAAAGALLRRPYRGAIAHLLVRADAAAAGEAALLALLQKLAGRGVKTVWLPVRDYMADALAAARLAGFEPQFTRAVLVQHTVVFVRQPAFARLREAPAALPAVNGSRLVHGGPVRQCRVHGDPRPRRRALPAGAP